MQLKNFSDVSFDHHFPTNTLLPSSLFDLGIQSAAFCGNLKDGVN